MTKSDTVSDMNAITSFDISIDQDELVTALANMFSTKIKEEHDGQDFSGVEDRRMG